MSKYIKFMLLFITSTITLSTSQECQAYVPGENISGGSSYIINDYEIVYNSDVSITSIDNGFLFNFDSDGVISYAKPDTPHTDESFYFDVMR